jgi:DNA-binding transcriptional regulator YiaG
MDSTAVSAPQAICQRIMFAAPMALLVGVGTGQVTFLCPDVGTGGGLTQRNFLAVASHSIRRDEYDASVQSPADDIGFIREKLKLSITELAKFLGVSRQAIYDWQSGSHIKSHNIAKLENLRAAAQVMSEELGEASSLQLNRKLPGGITLLQAIAAGNDGGDAARTLIDMLHREAQQRKALSAKFIGRKPAADSQFDSGMAAFRENS